MSHPSYKKLVDRCREIALYSSTGALLGWDQETNFPTYTLGNLGAAQLFEAACAQKPEIPRELASGQYGTLLGWLRGKVHGLGGQLLPGDLIEAATGKALSAEAHLEHLRRRYV